MARCFAEVVVRCRFVEATTTTRATMAEVVARCFAEVEVFDTYNDAVDTYSWTLTLRSSTLTVMFATLTVLFMSRNVRPSPLAMRSSAGLPGDPPRNIW